MAYTEESLREACRKIAASQAHTNPKLYATLVDAFSLFAVAQHIAMVCFAFQIENDESAIVREAMLDLVHHRRFSFEKEK